MSRMDWWIGTSLAIGSLLAGSVVFGQGREGRRAPPGGYEYSLIAAESQTDGENQKYVCNLNGQIALTYDRKVSLSNMNGINGIRWRGRPDRGTGPFTLGLSDITAPEKFRGKQMAYDLDGKNPAVVLSDDKHHGNAWEEVIPKEEWFKKYNKGNNIPRHLRAAQGKFKGYYLTFGELETVTVEKDRTYVRRPAILTKEPTELSVLLILQYRER